MSKLLADKIALVTGSSRGIGAAVAARLARDGASVVVNYASSADRADAVVRDIRSEGGEAEAVRADLRSPDGVRTLVAALDTAFGGRFAGRLDILVNNAGALDFGPFLEQSDEAYDRHFDINVRTPIALSREAGKRMAKAGWGRIINIGSAFGEAAPMGGATLYVATKFALHGFTRALSRELGPMGITVNGIQPGPTRTDLSPPEGSDAHAAMVRLTSVGRFGRPEEIAAAAAYLASPEASYTNGENLTVDGGSNA